jgi:hypothetical protein
MRRLGVLVMAAGVVLGAGCGEPGPRKYTVSGTVQYEGQPVAEGDVRFFPEDKSVGPEAGTIKNGRYSLKAREGKNRVEIRASRKVPGKKGAMGEDWVESYIPGKYNEESELSAEVGSGKTSHDFDLK